MEEQVASFMTGLQPKSPKKSCGIMDIRCNKSKWCCSIYGTIIISKKIYKNSIRKYEMGDWAIKSGVNNVHFVNKYKISNKKIQYVIAYDLLTSYANFGTSYKVITVKMNPEPYRTNWFISKIQTKNNQYEAFTPAETIIK